MKSQINQMWAESSDAFRASCAVAFSLAVVRFSFKPTVTASIASAGLLILEIGLIHYTEHAARRLRERQRRHEETCGSIDDQKLMEQAAEAEAKAIDLEIHRTQYELKEVDNAIHLHRACNFDVAAVAKTGLALALEAYRAAIERNRVRYGLDGPAPFKK